MPICSDLVRYLFLKCARCSEKRGIQIWVGPKTLQRCSGNIPSTPWSPQQQRNSQKISEFFAHFHQNKFTKQDSSVPQKHEFTSHSCPSSFVPHAQGPKPSQSQAQRPYEHLVENLTLVQKVSIIFRTIHLLASGFFGAVQAAVPLRAVVSTMITVWTTIFGIHTGAAILPAGDTPRVAIQPDRRLDEAGCKKKREGGCRECFHFYFCKSLARVSPQRTV